ncbi:YufK family protein [Salsuginibacillus kocurii]|uniref:YufK family protein n=1 Tax=Salsuginibacillus kocurii TaxID=427078 RepID=UPI00037B66B1|nr:YufK family protein [Salsuginibacillus kocurii]
MLKNTYITSYVPLFSILLFSTSLAIYTEGQISEWLAEVGLYRGMMEFFSEAGLRLMLLFIAMLFYFMVFSALKLIADTILELAMLFFSKDEEGRALQRIRGGSWIYLIGSGTSLISMTYLPGIAAIFLGTTLIYFIYCVYKIGDALSGAGMVGFIFFQVFFWCTFLTAVTYALLTLYNSFVASLPL